MNWTERRERFRALMASNRCVHTGSVYDAISARIAEELGFEVGIFSGSIGSMAGLCAPDLVVMTVTEFAAPAIRIPLITGGGAGQLADLNWMAAHNVRVALQGHAPFSAAVQAVYNTLKALRDGTKPGDLQGIASPELMQRVTRAADYRQWTRDFLGENETHSVGRALKPRLPSSSASVTVTAVTRAP